MTEATLQDFEEGLRACSEAAKTWMTVSSFKNTFNFFFFFGVKKIIDPIKY